MSRVATEAVVTDAPESTNRSSRERLDRFAPVLVGITVIFNLIELRAETGYVPLLNDGSIHAQMVRYATAKFQSGRLPLQGWYPYLGLGSPQFLHYQNLGAMVSGLIGVVIGADHAFNWSLYLVWSTWPISVYISARLFGLNRWSAAISGACATFVMSVPGVGFESSAYLWIGFGVWSQLFAMWTLPLAWAFSWRTIALKKPIWPAALFIAATICFHYITGYIAILATPIWVLVTPTEIWPRLRRLVLLGFTTFFIASWALVPLMVYGKWASINEYLQGTPAADSYGARQVLDWLFRGDIFDAGRIPVLTIFAAIGFIECLRRSRRDEPARALVIIFCFSVVLFFGRPTLGGLFDLLPRSQDLFLRRFMFGVQLSGLMLAGVGAVALGRLVIYLFGRLPAAPSLEEIRGRIGRVGALLGVIAIVVVVTVPAWSQIATYDSTDASDLAYQRTVNQLSGSQLQSLVSSLTLLGPGRVYAGLPTNWGENFVVGDVPVFKYLSNLDLDVVGYTLRTASMMTDPEAAFDETNPADYQIFGVRYLVIPETRSPAVPARFISQVGTYQLWMIPSVTGYFQLAETTDPISENRSNIGLRNDAFLASSAAERSLYPTVSYANSSAAPPTDPSGTAPSASLGTIVSQNDNFVNGQASVVVNAKQTTVVVMKVSYDPGWQATVDGLPVATEMVAPALVGVQIGPGRHLIAFQYVGYQHYILLFTLGAITLLIAIFGRRLGRAIGRTRPGSRIRRQAAATMRRFAPLETPASSNPAADSLSLMVSKALPNKHQLRLIGVLIY